MIHFISLCPSLCIKCEIIHLKAKIAFKGKFTYLKGQPFITNEPPHSVGRWASAVIDPKVTPFKADLPI